MSRTHRERETVWVVVRVDFPIDTHYPENSITVKEIVHSEALAEAEVRRLAELNADKGCIYFSSSSRLFPPGTSAGSRGMRLASDDDLDAPGAAT